VPIPPHIVHPHEGQHSADPVRQLHPEDFFEPLYYQSPSVHPHLLRTKKKVDPDALIGVLDEGAAVSQGDFGEKVAKKRSPKVLKKASVKSVAGTPELKDGDKVSESSAHYHIEVDGHKVGFEHSLDHVVEKS